MLQKTIASGCEGWENVPAQCNLDALQMSPSRRWNLPHHTKIIIRSHWSRPCSQVSHMTIAWQDFIHITKVSLNNLRLCNRLHNHHRLSSGRIQWLVRKIPWGFHLFNHTRIPIFLLQLVLCRSRILRHFFNSTLGQTLLNNHGISVILGSTDTTRDTNLI